MRANFSGGAMIRACANCRGTGHDFPRCPKLGYRFCSVACHEAIHARHASVSFGW